MLSAPPVSTIGYVPAGLFCTAAVLMLGSWSITNWVSLFTSPLNDMVSSGMASEKSTLLLSAVMVSAFLLTVNSCSTGVAAIRLLPPTWCAVMVALPVPITVALLRATLITSGLLDV